MTTKTVEQRIREHYQAENGEWLVEKGKMKEAKLLKEAVERISQQQRDIQFLISHRAEIQLKLYKLQETLQDREKRLDNREKRLQSHIASLQGVLERLKQ